MYFVGCWLIAGASCLTGNSSVVSREFITVWLLENIYRQLCLAVSHNEHVVDVVLVCTQDIHFHGATDKIIC